MNIIIIIITFYLEFSRGNYYYNIMSPVQHDFYDNTKYKLKCRDDNKAKYENEANVYTEQLNPKHQILY